MARVVKVARTVIPVGPNLTYIDVVERATDAGRTQMVRVKIRDIQTWDACTVPDADVDAFVDAVAQAMGGDGVVDIDRILAEVAARPQDAGAAPAWPLRGGS